MLDKLIASFVAMSHNSTLPACVDMYHSYFEPCVCKQYCCRVATLLYIYIMVGGAGQQVA